MTEIIGIIYKREYESLEQDNYLYLDDLFLNRWNFSKDDTIDKDLKINEHTERIKCVKLVIRSIYQWNEINLLSIITISCVQIKGSNYTREVQVKTLDSKEHLIGLINLLTKSGFIEVEKVS